VAKFRHLRSSPRQGMSDITRTRPTES
jgi:hypothetical protein